jgi:hypothetical protein
MDDDSDKRMRAGTHRCGFGVGFVGSATRPSRSCPTGWFRLDTMACVADNKPASKSLPVTVLSKPHHTAKIRRVFLMHPRYAVGYIDVCSAYGTGHERQR